ncbi:tyrosine-type recombinase/integrase [Rathayibacter soli]|uniref:tyrosine-type recombinase/integrase n=1 Tax=Rathayibacter soli TaxID=3144168 RepID=UPI0027E487AD|nr:site-specific integrase [Glaciibacter superstes]
MTRVRRGCYLAVTRYRDFDGDYRRVKMTGPTARGAENALKAKITEVGERSRHGDLDRWTRLRVVAEVWSEEERASERIAPQTMDKYEEVLRSIVLPALGSLRLGELTVGTVDRFLKKIAQDRPGRAKHCKVVLSHVLGLAVRHDAIPTNPVRQVGQLRRSHADVRVATLDELVAMREAIACWRVGPHERGPRPDGQLGKAFDVMLGTATRISETLAIRRCDLDLTVSPATVCISGTLVFRKGIGLIRQDHPKHSKHWRVIALPLFAENAIRIRLSEVGDIPLEQTIFCTKKGTYLPPANLRRQWRAVRACATGLPPDVNLDSITPHVFRKTGATTVAELGGIGLAAQLLGHSSTAITEEFYVRMIKTVDPATADMLEQLGPDRGQRKMRLSR